MRRIISVLSIMSVLMLHSCGSMMGMANSNKYGSFVKRTTNGTGGQVHYQSKNYLIRLARQEANNEMLDEEGTREKINMVPEGGGVIIEITNLTIELAKPEHYLYVLKDSEGEEIARKEGSENITPDYTLLSGTTYWSATDYIRLEKSLPEGPLKFYLINKLSQKRSDFLIYPDGRPQQ